MAVMQGGEVAAGSDLGEVKVWSVQTGALRRNIQAHNDEITAILVAKSGNLMTSGIDKYFRMWDGFKTTPIREVETSGVENALALLSNGDVASGGTDFIISVWNSYDLTLIRKLIGHTQSILCLAALKSGLLASSAGTELRVWNTLNGQMISKADSAHSGLILGLVALPNGNLVTQSLDNTIKYFAPTILSQLKSLSVTSSSYKTLVAFEDNDLATVEEFNIRLITK
jgi:WD40 repeat protein